MVVVWIRSAGQVLEVCERTLYRYLKKYRSCGLMFLKHGNRGRKPSNTHPFEVKAAAIKVMREVLFDLNWPMEGKLLNKDLILRSPERLFATVRLN